MGAHDWIGNLVQNGTIDPIQIPDDESEPLQPLAIKAVTFNGQVYGMPYTMNNIVLYRNTDLAPDAPATIEEMVAAGQAAQGRGQGRASSWPARSGRPATPTTSTRSTPRAAATCSARTPTATSTRRTSAWPSPTRWRPTRRSPRWARSGRECSSAPSRRTTPSASSPPARPPFLVDGPWQLPNLDEADIKYDVSPSRASRAASRPRRSSPSMPCTSPARARTRRWPRSSSRTSGPAPTSQLAFFEAAQGVPAIQDVLDQIEADDPLIVTITRPAQERPDHAEHPGDGGGLGPAGQGGGRRDRRRGPGVDHQVRRQEPSRSAIGSHPAVRGGPWPVPGGSPLASRPTPASVRAQAARTRLAAGHGSAWDPTAPAARWADRSRSSPRRRRGGRRLGGVPADRRRERGAGSPSWSSSPRSRSTSTCRRGRSR